MIKIKHFVFNPFQVNTYILSDDTGEAVIIDAACSTPKEEGFLSDYIEKQELTPKVLINTHGHVDHLLGANHVANMYNVPLHMHGDDVPLLERAREQAAMFGLELDDIPPVDNHLKDGDGIGFGDSLIKVLHVPGHSPGGIVLYSPVNKFVVAGDVLFHGSIGRTDLPGGDYNSLIEGIKNKLLALPDDVTVYSGHGPATTIGEEKNSNPFLR
jgi:glyoxylase-like metal-dependent hydrolase (beta-lactamase superfamily II)